MISLNFLARAAGSLVFAVPCIAYSAPLHSVPNHSNLVQSSIYAGHCIEATDGTTCVYFSTYRNYAKNNQLDYYTYFDLSEEKYLPNGYVVRYISCGLAVSTLAVDKNGATLAATVLDPLSQECYTNGYSYDNDTGEYDWDNGGFQDVLTVRASLNSPQSESSGNRNSVYVDNSTGARFKSTCIDGSGFNMLQGGFFINGDYFAMQGGPNAYSYTSYAKCVNLGK
jgi:hypothetical protein